MISCFLMGGLGNQLFQIFATLGLGFKYKCEVVFPYTTELTTGAKRPTYWDTIFASIKKITTYSPDSKRTEMLNNYLFTSLTQIKETQYLYDSAAVEEFKRQRSNACLYGYFQTDKYFKDYYSDIISLLNIVEQQNNIRQTLMPPKTSGFQTVSMHFRFSDYLRLQHKYKIMTEQYYRDALAHIVNKHQNLQNTHRANLQVFCFFEHGDTILVSTIVKALKTGFPNVEFQMMDTGTSDWQQLLMMSCCDHNIIANSTFSWWGAYLNQSRNKIVCSPDKWFTDDSVEDLLPKSWIQITI